MSDYKLIAMHQNAHVSLRSYSFQSEWTCEVESKDEHLMFKISQVGATPSEALDAAHAKWLRVTGAVPEFISALPPPTAASIEDAHDGDSFVQPPIDDELPF